MVGVLSLVLQLAVAALLFFSFAGKVVAGRRFNVSHLEKYRLVPAVGVSAVAALLPPVELMLGLGLVARVGLQAVLVTSAVLFSLFAAAMGSALRRRIVTECGCFGTFHSAQVSPKLVLRNLAIAAALLVMATTAAGHTYASLQVGTGTAVVLLGSFFAAGLVVSEVMSTRAPRRDPLPQ